MKRSLLLTALLALLATSAVLAAVPPSIWFQTNFDSYAAGTRLAWCAGWGETAYQTPGVIEPGMISAWPAKNVNCHIINTGPYCSASQSVVMQGYRPAETTRTLSDPSASCAQTNPAAPPAGVGWNAYAAGNVQILNFKMTKLLPTNQEDFPPLHATVFLMDNNILGAQPIMGWTFSTKAAKPQLNLPTYMGPNWTTNRYFSPEGTLYNWTDPYNTCREFTAVYDPSDGSAKFYVTTAPGVDTLLWSGNAGAGRVSQSIYVRDYIWTAGGGAVDVVCLDDLAVGTTAKPVVTAPVGGAFVTSATPTITWDKAFPAQTRASYQVKVCSSDDSNGTAVYTSAVLTDSAVSHVPTSALPTNQQLWAFVTETYSASTGWSLGGNGGFYCVTSVPTTPTVTSPSGTVVGAKPAVVFSGGVLHNQIQVKITTDSGGSNIVWDSGVLNTLKNGVSCEELLSAGTQYYAFAQATNPFGPSAWSAGSAFQVTRVGEGTDVMDMNETWAGSEDVLEHSAAAPEDGFGTYVGSGSMWAYLKRQVLPAPFNDEVDKNGQPANWTTCDWWPSGLSGDCDGQSIAYCDGVWIIPPEPARTDTELVGGLHPSDYVLSFWKTHISDSSNDMRKHRVQNVDLDKGVTVMTYAAGKCYEGEGCGFHHSRNPGEMAQIYVMDDYGTGKCMASFRYGRGEAGICVDNMTWTLGTYTDDQIPERPGQGYHIVRITGRNQIAGDPTTCLWKYYLDEDPTPLLTATGVMDQSRACIAGADIEDAIAIGCGDACVVGSWLYDWTAVNTSGDYAPGEWAWQTAEFATVSESVSCSSGTQVTIAGDAVITAVQTDGGTQVGFWVQDVGSEDRVNILLVTGDTTNVEVGHKVTGISGTFERRTGIGAATVQAMPALNAVTCTVTTADVAAPPFAMIQKNLVCGGLVDQYPEGSDTTKKFVRIVGRVTEIYGDAVYLDDGSGLLDGRSLDGNPSVLGVRIVDTALSFSGSIGDYYRIDGICASDKWVEGETNKKVRTILAPIFTLIPEP